MNYWIVARRFAHLHEELTRILRPLLDVRVITDRRVRRRLTQLRVFPEAPKIWTLPEKEAEDGGRNQDIHRPLEGIERGTDGT